LALKADPRCINDIYPKLPQAHEGVPASAWDACAAYRRGPATTISPILRFPMPSVTPMKSRGCVGPKRAGRRSIFVEDEAGRYGCNPMLPQSHSMGEYVFDHAWTPTRETGRTISCYSSGCGAFTPATGLACRFSEDGSPGRPCSLVPDRGPGGRWGPDQRLFHSRTFLQGRGPQGADRKKFSGTTPAVPLVPAKVQRLRGFPLRHSPPASAKAAIRRERQDRPGQQHLGCSG